MSRRLPIYRVHCAPSQLGSPALPCSRRECGEHLGHEGAEFAMAGAYTCASAFIADHPDGAPCELVAEQLGVSRERVRQLEAQAIRWIREQAAAVAAGNLVPAAPRRPRPSLSHARTTEQARAAGRTRTRRDVRDDGAVRCESCDTWQPADAFYNTHRQCKRCKGAAVMARYNTIRASIASRQLTDSGAE